MREKIGHFIKNPYFHAIIIIAAGIIMDLGVTITGYSLVTVTESYIDYIYNTIITIAILGFTIITLISGMLDNNYYGYKLREIIQFKNTPANFKVYIHWSFALMLLATFLLFAEFMGCSVNSLTMLLAAVIYLEWNMAHNIYSLMVDETICYKLVVNHYEALCGIDYNYEFYQNELGRVLSAYEICIKNNDANGKDCVRSLLIKLEKLVFERDSDNIDAMYHYFYNYLTKFVYALANNFGYNEMIRDVIKIYVPLSQYKYHTTDLYVIPLDNMRFWNDKLLLENNYFQQIVGIYFLDEYKQGLIQDNELEIIFFHFFKNILANQVCTPKVKTQIIDSYLHSLTQFYWKSKEDGKMPIDCIGTLNIWHDFVLKNEDIEERNTIFKILVQQIFYNNNLSDEKNYINVLSLMFQSFYAYAFCETETLNREYRNSLKETFSLGITNATLKDFKLSTLFRHNIEQILVAIGNRTRNKFLVYALHYLL